MGGYDSAVAGDEGANHMHWVHGVGLGEGSEVGGGEGGWRDGYTDDAWREQFPELEVGDQ